MMSFERRVVAALKIIGPKADRAAVEEAVAGAMREKPRRLRLLESGGVYFQPRNKSDKEGMRQLHAALRKVEALLGQKRLQIMFEKEPDLDQWLAKLSKMKRASGEFSQRLLPKPKPSKAGAKRTSLTDWPMSANDPKRTRAAARLSLSTNSREPLVDAAPTT